MHLTIVPGWWLLPLAITIAAFGLAKYTLRDNQPGGDYSFSGVVDAFVYMMAAIPSLVAWLVWAALS